MYHIPHHRQQTFNNWNMKCLSGSVMLFQFGHCICSLSVQPLSWHEVEGVRSDTKGEQGVNLLHIKRPPGSKEAGH